MLITNSVSGAGLHIIQWQQVGTKAYLWKFKLWGLKKIFVWIFWQFNGVSSLTSAFISLAASYFLSKEVNPCLSSCLQEQEKNTKLC